MIPHVGVSFLSDHAQVAYLNPQAELGCQVLQSHSLALFDEVHKGPKHALHVHTCSTCDHHLACSKSSLHVYIADYA